MALSGAHFTKSRGSDGADVLQTHLRTDATHRVSRKLFVCLESCHDKEQNGCTKYTDAADKVA